jgi:hypothetical protein
VNLLVPPLIAAAALSAYVAALSKDRAEGDDRRVAADSLVRHHEAAIFQAVALFPTELDPSVTVPVAPFIDVLDWNSALATDTQDRLWVLTYLNQGVGSAPTTISEPGVAGITYELQRLGFRSGTYGLWKAGTLASTIGPISFAAGQVPSIPDGAVMVATLCQETQPDVLDCGSDV